MANSVLPIKDLTIPMQEGIFRQKDGEDNHASTLSGEIPMKIQRTVFNSPLEALLALSRSLATFEQRHGMSSEEFYSRYTEGILGDERDLVEWAGDYQHYLKLKEELERKLEIVP